MNHQEPYHEWFDPSVESLIESLENKRKQAKNSLNIVSNRFGQSAKAHKQYIGLLDSIIELAQARLEKED